MNDALIMNFISVMEMSLGVYLLISTWLSKRNKHLKMKLSVVFSILFIYGFLGFFELTDSLTIEVIYIFFLYFMVLLYKREGLAFFEKIEALNKKEIDIMDALPDLIWEKDVKNRFVKTNKACREKLLLSKNKRDIYRKDIKEITENILEKGIKYKAGAICSISDDIVKTEGKACMFVEDFVIDGKPLYLLAYKVPLYDKKGKLFGTAGVGRDITEDVKEHRAIYDYYTNKQWAEFELMLERHVNKFHFNGENSKILTHKKNYV